MRRRRLLSFLVAAGLAGPLAAQIGTGTYTDGQGYSCRVEVSDTNGSGTPGVDVTVTDAGGSAAVNGTQASGSTDAAPSASQFPSTTTPRGNVEVRGKNGKVEKKNANGDWVPMRKVKKKKGAKQPPRFVANPLPRTAPAPYVPPSPLGLLLGPGEDVTSLPDPDLQAALAGPGEEGTSLPE